MEEQGTVRRGYFVAGLGAAQFAHPGAVDRLRSCRDSDEDPAVLVLAATDPAQPYGAVLPWPTTTGRPSRAAGATVALRDGVAIAHLDKAGRTVLLLGDEPPLDPVADALSRLAALRRVEVATVDGVGVAEHRLGEVLIARGWKVGYRGLRPPS
jgi:ATP-dependent Lhr-like helicase